jgi:signal transduction histidine kinase
MEVVLNSSVTRPWAIVTSQLIRHRLPRQIAVLLLLTVAAVVGAAYFELCAALIATAGDRGTSAASRLAMSLSESARQLTQEFNRIASDSGVQRALSTDGVSDPSREAIRRMLGARMVRAVIGVRLLDDAGNEVAGAGRWPAGLSIPQPRTAADSAGLTVGSFQTIGDTIYYAAALRVRVGGAVRGTIMEARRVAEPGAAGVFGALIGSGAELRVGNIDGQLWTNLERRTSGPSLPQRAGGVAEYRDADGVDRVGAAAPIARTPWVAWVDFPRSVVLAPARRFLFIVGGIALVVVLIGGFGGWLVSRRIAGPLQDVSTAAEDIAAGDLARRVTPGEKDEVGLLADCFNSMAARVEDAHRGLERRVAERTAELETVIGELHAAQESLVRNERLAMLGQLAGSVGHELRNPLGVMTNSLYLLNMLAPDDPPVLKEYVGIIKGQVLISEKIVGDLLDFARVKPPIRETFALDAVVAEQLKRVSNEAAVPIQCEAEVNAPHATADRAQVAQIVLNLVINAVQAVGETPGTVTLRCQRDAASVRLDVIDTGCGIPPKNLNTIFEPLFTTKARGIGLGLSVSRQLARANGGDIAVTSDVGVGSTFSLTLPIAAAG